MKRVLLTMLVLLIVVGFAFAGGQGEAEEAPAAAEVAQAGPVTIQWWHAMGGRLGEKVQEIADTYNASQDEVFVEAVYKGNYSETLTSGIAAYRSGNPPHILQVFEVGTATMMAAKEAIVPVYELMERTGEPFDPNDYISTVTGYYTTPEGEMLSMPFNSSTPVLYYNKEAFKKAGLDPNKPPKTWPEVAEYAKKLVQAGYKGFSTAWISWIQLENFSAWHDIPLATKANGFEGMDAVMKYDTGDQVKHFQALADWQKDGIFVYGGRRNNGNALFSSGEVAMYTESSAGYAGFKANAKFEFGTSMLPYWPNIGNPPQNTIIGGASLWVMEGHPQNEYEAVAKFFSYLSSPEVQADWHQFSGYLPITEAAYELTKKQGFYEKNPGTETSLKQMLLNDPTSNSRGVRLGNFPQIRDIHYEEFEAIFSGDKTAKQGLTDAATRANKLLREFEKANK